MNVNELSERLQSKLRLLKTKNHRHAEYRLAIPSGEVVLTTLLRVKRVSGELGKKSRRDVAVALGLNDDELRHMVECSIGRDCTLLAICNSLLQFVHRQYVEQGAVFMPGIKPMIHSVERLLGEISSRHGFELSDHEIQLMNRCTQELRPLSQDSHVGPMVVRLLGLMCAGCAFE